MEHHKPSLPFAGTYAEDLPRDVIFGKLPLVV
jgi:hypothetical protein